jgi:hypothetical protein
LNVLADAESRTLLTAALGDNPVTDVPVTDAVDPAVSELIALCEGFPLAALVLTRCRKPGLRRRGNGRFAAMGT